MYPLRPYYGPCECHTNSLPPPRRCRAVQNNGGIGPCPSAPASVKQEFYQLVVSTWGARKDGFRHGRPRPRAQRSRRAPRPRRLVQLARPTAANFFLSREQTQAPLGALEKAFPKSTAEKAVDACATLFFAEFSIGRRSRAPTTL